MNRKIKYLFFLVSFITTNTAILILMVPGCITLCEFVFSKIQVASGIRSWNTSEALFWGSSIANVLGLLLGGAISVAIYCKLYRYAEEKWYIHRIFDFSRKNSLGP
ncbi:hypothetical protein P0082_08950 [Candidatus Haliotispira prima]|uniref:DUF2062 domain-containing protein n=1 Tax=Candidatus Haliotispira prima TaxID=3034016 RepID=A0ABY8MIG7_9SPIO|nr:hypothetical protein P0082_08950 [Candidatus Haliotispira prima]